MKGHARVNELLNVLECPLSLTNIARLLQIYEADEMEVLASNIVSGIEQGRFISTKGRCHFLGIDTTLYRTKKSPESTNSEPKG